MSHALMPVFGLLDVSFSFMHMIIYRPFYMLNIFFWDDLDFEKVNGRVLRQ